AEQDARQVAATARLGATHHRLHLSAAIDVFEAHAHAPLLPDLSAGHERPGHERLEHVAGACIARTLHHLNARLGLGLVALTREAGGRLLAGLARVEPHVGATERAT